MKSILFFIVFIVSGLLSVIIIYSDDLSEKLTYNLNRNLNVDWGDDHPKFNKQNLIVDLLKLSISWNIFNIVFPKTKSAHMLNALSSIKSTGCISSIFLILKIQVDINCNEILIDVGRNSWLIYEGMRISSSYFFEHRVFDDLYDKQGNYKVTIYTNNLVVNKINLGNHIIKYSFTDKENLLLIINGDKVIFTKKHEGLKIHTADSDFFILNQNFYENMM